jgi:hypothetical protein
MIRSSFVPPPPIRRLRDLTRYRRDLVEACTAEKQRVEKLLEDAQIKLSAAASDIFGVSGRDMMAALVAGEQYSKVLARGSSSRLARSDPADASTNHLECGEHDAAKMVRWWKVSGDRHSRRRWSG